MDPRRRALLGSVRRITLGFLVFYLVYLAAAFVMQRKLLFPAWGMEMPVVDAPRGAESWWLEIEDGERVEAIFLRSPTAANPAPVVVLFHGNGETIHTMLGPAVAGYLSRGFHVLLPEYRGYGRSGGSPSQASIVADMMRFHDRVASRPEVDPDRIVFHGTSLGGGVAAALSRERKPWRLVLQSTFTSIRSFSWDFYAPGFLVRDPFDTEAVLRDLDRPVLILHGTRDGLVDVSHSRLNEAAARRATRLEFDAGHFVGAPAEAERYWKAIDDFLATRDESSQRAR